jgi:NAD(P)-dependent dehydrogenase (short-subunit alcohol dehydrogenase family)
LIGYTGTVKQEKGRIDILFANAGVNEVAPLGSITEAHFDKIFNINVKGLLFTVQKALPLFQDGGSIILTASVRASKVFEGVSVYGATKAAVRSFARSWTVDLKNRKIRVNAVSPGPIATPMSSGQGMGLSEKQVEEFKKNILSMVPVRHGFRTVPLLKYLYFSIYSLFDTFRIKCIWYSQKARFESRIVRRICFI